MIFKNTNTLLSIIAFSILTLFSCVDEFKANVPSPKSNTVVVEGEIISNSLCTFYISYASPLNSTVQYFAKVTEIKVVGNDGQVFYGDIPSDSTDNQKGNEKDNGKYTVNVGKLNPESEYHLEFTIEDENGVSNFWSEPEMPVTNIGISEVVFSESRGDGVVDILISTESSEDSKYLKWTYVEDWEVIAPYIPSFWYNKDKDCLEVCTEPRTRGWKNANSNSILLGTTENQENNKINKHRIYQINRSDDRFNTLYRTSVKQHAISKKQYDYETARKEMSGDMGGLFTPQPTELPTNIHSDNGYRIIGFIGVSSAVSEYEIYISKYDLSKYSPQSPKIYKDETSFGDTEKAKMLYNAGYQVLSYDNMLDLVKWVERWGVDVTAHPTNASLNCPLDWPNAN